jgi:hypothetical protein
MSWHNSTHELRRQTKVGAQWLCFLFVCMMLALSACRVQAQATLNVTNYGAKGDAVQIFINTVSNSATVTTTSQFSSADIGKTIQVYRVGKPTQGVNSYNVTTNDWQDLIAIVTNVVKGTNLYLNVLAQDGTTRYLPQRTLANVPATIGTDNRVAFSNCIAAASANATIYIPNGKYLIMPLWKNADCYAFGSIVLKRGGLHFLGESQSGTVLLGRSAWQSYSGIGDDTYPFRGFLFEVMAPVTSDLPLTFDNMTWDGGVASGWLNVQGIQANRVDGLGWDEQHSAILTIGNGLGTTVSQLIFTNLTVMRWRGEMFKSIDGYINRNVTIKNCWFYDGNATALNIYGSYDVTSNRFEKLFQVAEYFQKYYTNVSYFRQNFVTNITGNGWAWNGGVWTAPMFIMQSNIFYFNGSGQNGIQTMPGANIAVLDNEIHCVDYMTVFSIGGAGAQGSQINSNILIAGNSIYAPAKISTVFSFGGADVNAVAALTICSNRIYAPEEVFSGVVNYGQATGVTIQQNVFESGLVGMKPGENGSTYVLLQTNNAYWGRIILNGEWGPTNRISYGGGARYLMKYPYSASVPNYLATSDGGRIPSGAAIILTNNAGNMVPVPVYLNEAMTNSVTIPYQSAQTFYWSGSAWTTNLPRGSRLLAPPNNLRTN